MRYIHFFLPWFAIRFVPRVKKPRIVGVLAISTASFCREFFGCFLVGKKPISPATLTFVEHKPRAVACHVIRKGQLFCSGKLVISSSLPGCGCFCHIFVIQPGCSSTTGLNFPRQQFALSYEATRGAARPADQARESLYKNSFGVLPLVSHQIRCVLRGVAIRFSWASRISRNATTSRKSRITHHRKQKISYFLTLLKRVVSKCVKCVISRLFAKLVRCRCVMRDLRDSPRLRGLHTKIQFAAYQYRE